MTLQNYYETIRMALKSSGRQLEPHEYNTIIKKVNLLKWEKERKRFEEDQMNMDTVAWLKKTKELSFSDGYATIPSDYGTKASCLVGNVDVEFVQENTVGGLKRSSLYPPSATEPVIVQRGGKFVIIPSTVSSASLVYLKKFDEEGDDHPNYVWKVDSTTGLAVYDPDKSVEFGWPQSESMDLLNMMLEQLGIIKTSEK